ncbi:hypothetical protein [Beijerinckia indica]|uniref:Uncharacterized protein n=1 Tax=Beijerinckia indica subsp. indica (strain ATCC 9039 / DSM 1715 / NCIMB 8712) TaxID=395963 RepID=B2IEV5_BEII9|nr:hypothetical protein [Beijerinckia indica]ACB94146.1 hypothetical protein Bind_0493 [Beijerinckia indica subsp. indica ATCC 9039]
MSVQTSATCSNCRFWEQGAAMDPSAFDDRPRGTCRRSPPQTRSDFDRIIADYLAAIARHLNPESEEEAFAIHDSDAASETYWPLTVGEDWCGEYQQRPS